MPYGLETRPTPGKTYGNKCTGMKNRISDDLIDRYTIRGVFFFFLGGSDNTRYTPLKIKKNYTEIVLLHSYCPLHT